MNSFNQSFKSQKPSDKMPDEKREKINRIIYISAIALLLAVVIIAAVVSATNRAKKEPVETPSPSQPSTPDTSKPDTPKPDTPDTPDKPEDKPEDKPTEDVSTKLPSFVLPISEGALSIKHDPDLQVFSPTLEEYRVHLGIDLNTAADAPVSAAADGEITKIWQDVNMGTCIAVSHNGGAISYYKNLSDTLADGIEVGKSVKAGQLLGKVGESAMIEVAQEPHLHFELTVGGLQVDPLKYFGDEDLKVIEVDASVEE